VVYPRYSNLIISMALLDNMTLFLLGFRLLATFDTVGGVLFAGASRLISGRTQSRWHGRQQPPHQRLRLVLLCYGLEQSRCEISSHLTFPTTTTLYLG
jgi:hypothetical protein